MPPPAQTPIGLQLARTARVVGQAFDRALQEAGGSAPAWQVLVLIRSRQWGNQSKLAEAMGITGATLTHHLNALEKQGIVRRWRDEGNRRVQHVELTPDGDAQFLRLRDVATAFDARLRAALSEADVAEARRLLDALAGAVG
jgi:MarR family transcriptional regulator for hemolysin